MYIRWLATNNIKIMARLKFQNPPLIMCYYLSFKTRITIKWYDPFYRAIANVGQPKSCWYLKLDCVEKASNRTATICGSATYTSSSCSNSYIAVVILLLLVVVVHTTTSSRQLLLLNWHQRSLVLCSHFCCCEVVNNVRYICWKIHFSRYKYLNPHSPLPPPPNCPLKFHPCSEVAAFVQRLCQNGQRRT